MGELNNKGKLLYVTSLESPKAIVEAANYLGLSKEDIIDIVPFNNKLYLYYYYGGIK